MNINIYLRRFICLYLHTPNNEKYNRKEYEDRYDVKESGIIYDKLKKKNCKHKLLW